MENYERQQFDFLLQSATERFAERLQQRFRGSAEALRQLSEAPESDGVWLYDFTDALFEDFLLNNIDGACFVLKALSKKPLPGITEPTTVEVGLVQCAKQLFTDLLRKKTIEALESQIAYQPVQLGDH